VVSVFDVARHGEATYITMEYLEGKSLRAWLRENRRAGREIPLSAAVSILTQVLAGLAEAHRQNIVHRDLKPENVMLVGDPLAGECRLKLLDFAIARALDAGDALTRTGAVVGTPAYMAPEQRAGADAMGPPADLWAAGAMLYEILTEVPPEGRWPAPSEVRPDLPAALDAVVSKALEHHPKRRYASSGEMASALGSLGKTTEKVNEGRLNEAIEDDMVQGLMAQVLRDPEAGLAEARPLQ
jgi:serine/threonine protein kinase